MPGRGKAPNAFHISLIATITWSDHHRSGLQKAKTSNAGPLNICSYGIIICFRVVFPDAALLADLFVIHA